jgi:hypothetical protein
MDLIRKAMSIVGLTIECELTITVTSLTCGPEPAGVGLMYARVEFELVEQKNMMKRTGDKEVPLRAFGLAFSRTKL